MRAASRGTKRTIAGVLATGVILFAGIAGQAQADAGGCKVTFGGSITTADGDKATFGGIALRSARRASRSIRTTGL